jgi:hypothetical protein
LPCLFHADDPFFLASSRGALQQTLDVVAAWTKEFGPELHVGPRKTVGMTIGLSGHGEGTLTYEGVALTLVTMHRYLGVLWPRDLDFTHFLQQRLQFASAELAQLAGFASSRSMPWLIVCELFETKIDSILDFGRWLFALVPGARTLIDDFYNRSARVLLGADFWRNPGPCASELGWQSSGFDRVVRCVALRRAKLWSTVDSNWHATFFQMSVGTQGSWAQLSGQLLKDWSILDWPSWHATRNSLEDYKFYVDKVIGQSFAEAWRSVVDRHRAHIPYLTLESSPGVGIRRWRGVTLPTETQMSLRSWSRLRCGLLVLAHIGGKESAARYQYCIFCNDCVRNSTVHCLSLCSRWVAFRSVAERWLSSSAQDGAQTFALQCLRSDISVQALEAVAAWASELDNASYAFWH